MTTELWPEIQAKIESIDSPEELLRYIHDVESRVNQFFRLKGQAFARARDMASSLEQRTEGGKVRQLARDLGYRGRQFSQYASVASLLAEATPEALSLLDAEAYWLDALRRKPSSEYIAFAVKVVKDARSTNKLVRPTTVRALWDASHATFSPVIKPTDNWNFTRVIYQPDNNTGTGYIPGEIYANCFWYFVKPGDIVVDPMAGSGMAERVYLDRERWLGAERLDFDLQMFDLTPRKATIRQNDLLTSFPVSQADYIFIDLPYWGRCFMAYSENPRDLANMDRDSYSDALNAIAHNCAEAQLSNGLCSVLIGNYTDVVTGEVVLFIEQARSAWQSAGYRLYHVAYASRHSQQVQHPGMANLNNVARRNRTTLTDMIEVLTFQKR